MFLRKAILIPGSDGSIETLEREKDYEFKFDQIMVRDAARMSKFLSKPMAGAWRMDRDILFVNSSQKTTSVEEQISMAIRENTGFIFFYYVGHGSQDEFGNGIMQFCIDVDGGVSQFMSIFDLEAFLNKKKVRNYLIFYNACRQSGIVERKDLALDLFELDLLDTKGGDENKYDESLRNLKDEKVVVYSTLSGQSALFSDGGNLFNERLFKSIDVLSRLKPGKNLSIKDVVTLTSVKLTII